MKKLACTICLILIISGCEQTSSTSSYDWPEHRNYMEAISGDKLPSREREVSLSPDTGPTEEEMDSDIIPTLEEMENEPNPITIIEVGESAGDSLHNYPSPKISLTELEKLHQWVQDGLASGAVHSINVEYNEIRMDPIPWSLVPIESKRIIIQCFSRYFDLKGSTGRVIIRSKYSDEKLASYSVWTGIKIYK